MTMSEDYYENTFLGYLPGENPTIGAFLTGHLARCGEEAVVGNRRSSQQKTVLKTLNENVLMTLFQSSGFTPFLAGQMGETVHVWTHQGIFFIAVFDFVLVGKQHRTGKIWGYGDRKASEKCKKRHFCPISPNYAQLQPTDTRKKR